jgi:type III pantothenate kinase
MSEMINNMLLAIDAGNTRTKWGMFDDTDELQAQGVVFNTELQFEQAWEDCPWHLCKKAVVSNVAGADIGAILQALFHQHALDSYWVKSSASACGLINGYSQPEMLGSDRWAALVAAWHLAQSPCVVVNAGTALTIDAIGLPANQATFLGGIIVPGLQLMQRSLLQNTAGISNSQGAVCDFPQNTGDAVYTGAVNAMTGAVANMAEKLQRYQLEHRQSNINRCMITGGDAAMLAEVLRAESSLACEFIVVENLVLQGLLLIERNAE